MSTMMSYSNHHYQPHQQHHQQHHQQQRQYHPHQQPQHHHLPQKAQINRSTSYYQPSFAHSIGHLQHPGHSQVHQLSSSSPSRHQMSAPSTAVTSPISSTLPSTPSTVPSSASSASSAAKDPNASGPKRARVTGRRLEVLLREFRKNTNPTPEQRKLIAQDINLSERSVRIWFQNRRAKTRKEQREKEARTDSSPTGTGAEEDRGLCVPVQINSYYSFIHACSITVGQWQRVKQESATNYIFNPVLPNLAPKSLEALMRDPLDLAVIFSAKDNELNYFFTSYSDGQKIIFRIFYPLHDISSSSLLPSATKTKDSDGEQTNSVFNNELILFLKRSPKFAVYFPSTNSNTWTISDDFSINKQVQDAYFGEGGNGLPHRIIGRSEPLKFLFATHNHFNAKHGNKPGAPPANDEGIVANTGSIPSTSYNLLSSSAFGSDQPDTTATATTEPVNSFDPLSSPSNSNPTEASANNNNNSSTSSHFSPAFSNYNFPSALSSATSASFPSSTGFHSHTQSTSSLYSLSSPAPTPTGSSYPSLDFYQFHTNPGGPGMAYGPPGLGYTNNRVAPLSAYSSSSASTITATTNANNNNNSNDPGYPPYSASAADSSMMDYNVSSASSSFPQKPAFASSNSADNFNNNLQSRNQQQQNPHGPPPLLPFLSHPQNMRLQMPPQGNWASGPPLPFMQAPPPPPPGHSQSQPAQGPGSGPGSGPEFFFSQGNGVLPPPPPPLGGSSTGGPVGTIFPNQQTLKSVRNAGNTSGQTRAGGAQNTDSGVQQNGHASGTADGN